MLRRTVRFSRFVLAGFEKAYGPTARIGLALLSGLTPGGSAEAAGSRNAWFVLHVALSVSGVALMALASITILTFVGIWYKRHGLARIRAGAKLVNSPQVGLGGAVPLDYAETELGAREVEDLLSRIEYGVYS